MRIGFTTICVPTELHAALEQLKVHPRQSYHEVIETALFDLACARMHH